MTRYALTFLILAMSTTTALCSLRKKAAAPLVRATAAAMMHSGHMQYALPRTKTYYSTAAWSVPRMYLAKSKTTMKHAIADPANESKYAKELSHNLHELEFSCLEQLLANAKVSIEILKGSSIECPKSDPEVSLATRKELQKQWLLSAAEYNLPSVAGVLLRKGARVDASLLYDVGTKCDDAKRIKKWMEVLAEY